jgi:hypothetical protein
MQLHRLVADPLNSRHEGCISLHVFAERDREIQMEVDEVGLLGERPQVGLKLLGSDDVAAA